MVDARVRASSATSEASARDRRARTRWRPALLSLGYRLEGHRIDSTGAERSEPDADGALVVTTMSAGGADRRVLDTSELARVEQALTLHGCGWA